MCDGHMVMYMHEGTHVDVYACRMSLKRTSNIVECVGCGAIIVSLLLLFVHLLHRPTDSRIAKSYYT